MVKVKKYFLTLICVLALVTAFLGVGLNAFADGETGGGEEVPVTLEISDEQELIDFAAKVNGTGEYEGSPQAFEGEKVVLKNSITLSEGDSFTPIGNGSRNILESNKDSRMFSVPVYLGNQRLPF